MKTLATFAILLTAQPAFNAIASESVVSAQLNPELAKADATSDFARGVCRLYAVEGYTWVIPATRLSVRDAEATYAIVYISDTSDAITAENEAANKRAWEYASQYNKVAVKNCEGRK